MEISKILSEKEIATVKDYVSQGVPYNELRKLFPRFNKLDATIFSAYYNKLKDELAHEGSVSLGAKEEPYNTSEDVDELYPQYTWKELSKDEKAWYNIRVKNKIK